MGETLIFNEDQIRGSRERERERGSESFVSGNIKSATLYLYYELHETIFLTNLYQLKSGTVDARIKRRSLKSSNIGPG